MMRETLRLPSTRLEQTQGEVVESGHGSSVEARIRIVDLERARDLFTQEGPLVETPGRLHDQGVRAQEEVLVDDAFAPLELVDALVELPMDVLPEEEVVDVLLHLLPEAIEEQLLGQDPATQHRLDRRDRVTRVLPAEDLQRLRCQDGRAA